MTFFLIKLFRYGFRRLADYYLKSYLSVRQIYIELGGESLDLFPVHGSVPQGSCLGPILYSVIHDLSPPAQPKLQGVLV